MRLHWSLWLTTATAARLPASAKTARMTLVKSGATNVTGGYVPQRLNLTQNPPAALKKAPRNLVNALYGTLTFGPKEHPRTMLVALSQREGGADQL